MTTNPDMHAFPSANLNCATGQKDSPGERLENLKDLDLFAEKHPQEWEPRQQFMVYRNAQERFVVTCEVSTQLGLSPWRDELLAQAGIDSGALDCAHLAKTLVKRMGHHLSICDLEALHARLEQELASRRAERTELQNFTETLVLGNTRTGKTRSFLRASVVAGKK